MDHVQRIIAYFPPAGVDAPLALPGADGSPHRRRLLVHGHGDSSHGDGALVAVAGSRAEASSRGGLRHEVRGEAAARQRQCQLCAAHRGLCSFARAMEGRPAGQRVHRGSQGHTGRTRRRGRPRVSRGATAPRAAAGRRHGQACPAHAALGG